MKAVSSPRTSVFGIRRGATFQKMWILKSIVATYNYKIPRLALSIFQFGISVLIHFLRGKVRPVRTADSSAVEAVPKVKVRAEGQNSIPLPKLMTS
jgi:hypothetical protein